MHKIQPTYLENKTLIWLAFENPRVEYHHTNVSFDLLSLIGEIGGILGVTLSVSGMTLFDSIFQRIPFY